MGGAPFPRGCLPARYQQPFVTPHRGRALAGNNIGTEAVVGAQRGAIGTPVRTATPHVDQNRAPNNFLVNDPWWSTQGIGGSCGR